MKLKRLLLGAVTAVLAWGNNVSAAITDSEGYPIVYIRGAMTGDGWAVNENYRFTRNGNEYTLTLPELNGSFKLADDNWQQFDFGGPSISSSTSSATLSYRSGNMNAEGLQNVTFSFSLSDKSFRSEQQNGLTLRVSFPSGPVGPTEPDEPRVPTGMSGKLPVLYINVYKDEEKAHYQDEIIDRNLDHKNYFTIAEYWLEDENGAALVGSKDAPEALSIKARGNYTRLGFAKKPFKLKLAAKTSLLGLSKSKHFALLAHADDNFGYMRNFTGFWLGRAIGLPWTPDQRPVEVVINGDYRGLYFLTESIRIEKDRVNISELDDLTDDPTLISGGYIVELDNYDEPAESQLQLPEKSCVSGQQLDVLRVTYDTPEEYSDLQKRFIKDQFTAMNDAVGEANRSDELWRYMDLDDAAKYYLVEEIISHTESYHGSTYLFRDRGEGQKWHFSPLWDCGNAFNGRTDNFFYNCDLYGNTWIPSMRANEKFNNKVKDLWAWFMNNGYKDLYEALEAYAELLKEPAKADRARWKDAPKPTVTGVYQAADIIDNTDMQARLNAVLGHLSSKIGWLKGQFGDYTRTPEATEPARDTTEAAPLPEYATENFDIYSTYPELYLIGANYGGWNFAGATPFVRQPKTNIYELHLDRLSGEFKIAGMGWDPNFGPNGSSNAITGICNYTLALSNGQNNISCPGDGLSDVTLRFTLEPDGHGGYNAPVLKVAVGGVFVEDLPVEGLSGTLPVLYINVYSDETHSNFENEIIDRDLSHKNYFTNAEYWLDINGCEWLEAEGAQSVGSKEEPLPLQIKARGNYTRTGFSKKPFKLKLGAKASLLGLSKSKHFALLTHADDAFGYMRNFTGFWLGKAAELPWTPWQQPVEVVINGNYRGLYFLTESIRVEKDRVNITELDDEVNDPALISGGYIVELDNYLEDENQFRIYPGNNTNMYPELMVTYDTPEVYSPLQEKFISEQFTTIHNLVKGANDDLWKYLDLDDAARYYIVEEIISHYEAYHGSTYLFRDHGEGEKWHFSPLWDCGHAFEGGSHNFFYDYPESYGNTWVRELRQNARFNDKAKATFRWILDKENGYSKLFEALDAYAAHLKAAATADYQRWHNEPLPSYNGNNNPTPVTDNRDIDGKLAAVKQALTDKVNWLKGQFDYNAQSSQEPERDTTEAAPLPSYARPGAEFVELYFRDEKSTPWQTVYAYTYLDGVDMNTPVELKHEHLGAWPGTAMELVSGSVTPSSRRRAAAESPYWKVTLPVTELEGNHKVIFNDGNRQQTDSYDAGHLYVYTVNDEGHTITGVDNVAIDSEPEARYYDLLGLPVAKPEKGHFYILHKGSETRTIRF
ncbi:MAG: CotH kinase family protein [Muribaculaceae bacterium]|nr:CotH kinase family protein [Muribaculaceae bacterium]